MIPHIPEKFSNRLIDWSPFVIIGNAMPPRDPDEDEADEDEEEGEEDRADERPGRARAGRRLARLGHLPKVAGRCNRAANPIITSLSGLFFGRVLADQGTWNCLRRS